MTIAEVEPPPEAEPISSAELGKVFDFSVGQAELAQPVLLRIPYEHKPGMTADDVRALHWNEDAETWEALDGAVDEANQVVIVEVSELSWFTTIIRTIFSYKAGDAEIESCAIDQPNQIRALQRFKLSAEATNHVVEHEIYVEFSLTNSAAGESQTFDSSSSLLEQGDSGEFGSGWIVHPSRGSLSVKCAVRVGGGADFLRDWLNPALDSAELRADAAEPPEYVVDLAQRYAPALRAHPDEKHFPRGVEWFIEHSAMKDGDGNTVVGKGDVRLDSLASSEYGQEHYLDAPDDIADPDDLSTAMYWTIRPDDREAKLYLQYYQFYNYDYLNERQAAACDIRRVKQALDAVSITWCEPHEADWELIQFEFEAGDVETIIERDVAPARAAYSQHGWSETKAYNAIETYRGYPLAYVALGKHANYFGPEDDGGPDDDGSWRVSFIKDEISVKGVALLPPSLSGGGVCQNAPSEAESCEYYDLRFADGSVAWIAYNGKWGGSKHKIDGLGDKTSWNDPGEWMRIVLGLVPIPQRVINTFSDAAAAAPEPTPTPEPAPTVAVGRIAFESDRDGNWEIYVMNADGSGGLTRLTDNDATDWDTTWSPDGRRIAFASYRDGNWEIYATNADGSGGLMRLTDNDASDRFPAWSPDGRRIAFESYRNGNWEIYATNADGSGGLTRLTDNDASDRFPAWSPDGRRIAFESYRDGNWEIYAMNADGSGGLTRLTDNDADDRVPTWSPDGRRIAFESDRDGNWEIYTMNADGSGGLTRLTDNDASDGFPAWSPSGQRIAFESYRDGNWEIYVINADGSGGLTQLTYNDADDRDPAWSPDGVVALWPHPPSFGPFQLTTGKANYPNEATAAVRNEFGDGWRIADWNDLRAAWAAHEEDIKAIFENWGGAIVTWNGESQWGNTERTFFVEDHNGSRPSYFLAHDELGGHEVSLGSWTIWEWGGDGLRTLAIRD